MRYQATVIVLLGYFIRYSELFQHNYAEEYILTSTFSNGIKRSNVCGEGYRIDGAVLRSYPYSINETYSPYENCLMTFQSRRSMNSMLIRILILDLNDISAGKKCLDTLHFYDSVHINNRHRLNSVECGQLTEVNNFSIISSTGIVTAHFSTDSGNVQGLGFRVVLTSFRYPNRTHPCEPFFDEYLCQSGECISTSLINDGIAHCPDKSDEGLFSLLTPSSSTSRSWYGKPMLISFCFLLILFIIFLICCLRHYYVFSSTKSYVTMSKIQK